MPTLTDHSAESEEAFFEVWWALHRQRQWEKNNLDRGPKPTEAYMTGLKDWYRAGWMARASLHVVGNPSVQGKKDDSAK